MNQGVHTVDLLLWLMGPVRRVSAKVATRLHAIEVEDTAVAVLEFANGALGTIEATTAAYPGYARRVEVTGSNGTAILEGDALVALDLQDGSGFPRQAVAAPENAASPVVSDVTPHRTVVEDFIRAVNERARPACDGAEGRRSVEVITAIYQASRTGAPVDVTGCE